MPPTIPRHVTILPDDVGRDVLIRRLPNGYTECIILQDDIARVLPKDVGRRLYQYPGSVVWEAESDYERAQREQKATPRPPATPPPMRHHVLVLLRLDAGSPEEAHMVARSIVQDVLGEPQPDVGYDGAEVLVPTALTRKVDAGNPYDALTSIALEEAERALSRACGATAGDAALALVRKARQGRGEA